MKNIAPWKMAALVVSIALAAAFVGYRVWNAANADEKKAAATQAPPAGTPPPEKTAAMEEVPPEYFGGSKSLVIDDFVQPPKGQTTGK